MITFYVGNTTANTTAIPSPLTSTSQAGQDLIVLDVLNNKTNGYFLDLAAHAAAYISNTFVMETKYNWTGICIDADFVHYSWDLAHRTSHVLIAALWKTANSTVPFVFTT